MRQSGLSQQCIKELRIKNLEPSTKIPRKINMNNALKQRTAERSYCFIGEEASKYIEQYLAKRNNLTPESFLFSAKNNPNKEIITKNMSRAFSKALEKIDLSKKGKFTLFSLIEFYRENTKHYQTEIKNNPNRTDEYYRKLYKEKAMPFLEIESPITIKINPTKKRYRTEFLKRDKRIKKMEQTIARDSEYISSILSLLYSNRGNPETRENEEIGDRFIELWKEVSEFQLKNLRDVWQSEGKIKLLPMLDIVEELTKTLKRIKKPYDKLERKITHDSIKDMG
jgi:hypothetical protein